MELSESEPSTSSSLKPILREKREKIYLIGYPIHQITGSKLPSNGQVLRSLFHNKREVKLETQEAARLTIREVLLFWEKAKIPTKHEKDCIKKLVNLHTLWRNLQKNSSRKSEAQTKKEKALLSTLDNLFDIAHQDALKLLNEEDRNFLLLQRKEGRVGCMGGVSLKYLQAEARREKRRAAEVARREQSQHDRVGTYIF